MIPNTSFNVSSVQVSQLPLQISQIEGFAKSDNPAQGNFLQLFDSCLPPQAGAVPLWEIPVYSSMQFQETLQVARANCTEGIWLGLSTTEGTYTAAATHMDITVWTDQTPLATNVVGDKTTGRGNLQVWTQNVANKKLYGLIITETAGNPLTYIIINAVNGASGSGNALYSNQGYIFTLTANQTKKFYFATNGGLQPNFIDLNNLINNGAGVLYTGCTIWLSSTIPVGNGTSFTNAGSLATICAITN